MSAGLRTYVATAFVPFTRRRPDAVADLLVEGLLENGLRAERLRIPVNLRSARGAAGSAAAAALVDLTRAQRVVALEFPATHLLHRWTIAWQVRGALSAGSVAGSGQDHPLIERALDAFSLTLVEPSISGITPARPGRAPSGLISAELARRGLVGPDGIGVVTIALHPSVIAQAQDAAGASGEVVLVPPPHGGDVVDLDDAVWAALDLVPPREYAGVRFVVPRDSETLSVEAAAAAAGAFEEWIAVEHDGSAHTDAALGAGIRPDAIRRAWAEFAGELMV